MKKARNKMLAVSILGPVLLFTLLSGGMAVRQLKHDTAVMADILMSQIDHVTRLARHATRTTAGMADQPCDKILEKITANGAFTPYIRSTGLIRGDALVCSSVTGVRKQDALAVYGSRLAPGKDGVRIFAIPGTSSVPGQEAIIYASRAGKNMTAFSVVDARYFIDLMESLDDENHSTLKLRFSDGPVIKQREDGRAISPAVFISAAAHLADKTFVTDVLRLWISLDPSITLLLEITERFLVEDTRTAANKLNELRQKGCHVAVDDFGTGYCSFNVLQHLPVDYLKIDKSFIDTLSFAGADTPVLDTIIGLSKRLGFATISCQR